MDKDKILKMLPDIIEALHDEDFKEKVITAKNDPSIATNPMALMTLVLPKLQQVLQKNGYNQPDAPQQFFMAVLMNQNDPDILKAIESIKSVLSA